MIRPLKPRDCLPGSISKCSEGNAGGVRCLPTAYWRDGDFLYIHGVNNSRLTGALLAGECAVAISHLDGLVLARSAFRHSMNYRSVVIYGRFAAVDDENDKKSALAAFLNHASPGRNTAVRPSSPAERAGTTILRPPQAEAAAKIRNRGAADNADDLTIPVWAGAIPLGMQAGRPQPKTGCVDLPRPDLPLAFLARQSDYRSRTESSCAPPSGFLAAAQRLAGGFASRESALGSARKASFQRPDSCHAIDFG